VNERAQGDNVAREEGRAHDVGNGEGVVEWREIEEEDVLVGLRKELEEVDHEVAEGRVEGLQRFDDFVRHQACVCHLPMSLCTSGSRVTQMSKYRIQIKGSNRACGDIKGCTSRGTCTSLTPLSNTTLAASGSH
jgi:hypothetical protein